MNRVVRIAAAAALVASGTGTIGCTHTGQPAGDGAAGGGAVYRQFIDPCWPERYSATARSEVIAPFATQVNNGSVMNQTIWNWYFEPGTEKLTSAGRAKLDSITQTRPMPDTRLYLQAARDVPVTPDNIDKVGATREDLTAKRAAAVQKYMATQPAIGGTAIAYEIHVHDAVPPGIAAEFAATSYRGQSRGYTGVLVVGGGASGGGAGATGTGSAGGMTSGSTGAATGSGGPPTGSGTPTGP